MGRTLHPSPVRSWLSSGVDEPPCRHSLDRLTPNEVRDPPCLPSSTIYMRLRLKKILEYGGFSRVYVAEVTSASSVKVVAVKKQRIMNYVKNPMTRHEAAAFLLLKVYAWGRSQYWEYLAMELLGDTVTSVVLGWSRPYFYTEKSKPQPQTKQLTMRNLVALTVQMLDAIEHVHSHDIIHGDIKPGNFLFGIGPNAGRIYLVDYGLSRYYQDPVTKEHVLDEPLPYFLGTTYYSSIKAHFLHSPSRCDDMESLSYTVARLLRNELPWSKIAGSQEACTDKQKWSGPDLCAGYPSVFGDFIDYTRDLKFSESPDYARWRNAFLEVVPELQRDTCEYDASDTSPPYVGASLSLTPNSTASSLPLAPKSNSQNSLPSSEYGWMPTSSWPTPTQVKDEWVFRNEEMLVRDGVEHISEPPSMDSRYLLMSRLPEAMQKYDSDSSFVDASSVSEGNTSQECEAQVGCVALKLESVAI